MTIHANTWLLRRKWILVAVGLPVLVALWWAFRPEKLWINEKVNEAAPFDTSAGPQPILIGRFEGNAQQTSGRATIFKKPGGEEYLHLSAFSTANGPDTHVLLAQSGDPNLAPIDCGPLKSSEGDQNYDFPSATALNKYQTVIIYGERSHTVFGLAKLEPF
ncbi:MAG TPA: DM13 domain-containing protein [Bryobacteraceae bacterium]|nr:DM13 domain-containing protein [Bryobacteraceae bacterium]